MNIVVTTSFSEMRKSEQGYIPGYFKDNAKLALTLKLSTKFKLLINILVSPKICMQ